MHATGALRLTRTVFRRNLVLSNGGGVLLSGADDSFVTDCQLTSNDAVSCGGGREACNTHVTITGWAFRGNAAPRGGGRAVRCNGASIIGNGAPRQPDCGARAPEPSTPACCAPA